MKRLLSFMLMLLILFAALTGCTKPEGISEYEGERSKMSIYLTEENGVYTLTLPESKETIELDQDEVPFVPYITDELVEAAEKKIAEDIAEYNNSSGFYLQISQDNLCLVQEVIHHMDPPAGSNGEDTPSGCGIDHEHLFFSQRITHCPVNELISQPRIGFPDDSVGKSTAEYLSGYLDQIHFVAGLPQSDFISQVEQYRYDDTGVLDVVEGFHNDYPTGCGWSATGSLFGFQNSYIVDEEINYDYYTNYLYTTVSLEGLDLPYGIQFGDTVEDVFRNIGIEGDPHDDFVPGATSDTDMTLYREDDFRLVFQDLRRTKDPVDFELPYVLVFTETYDIQQETGKITTVERMIRLNFNDANNHLFSRLEIYVSESTPLQ